LSSLALAGLSLDSLTVQYRGAQRLDRRECLSLGMATSGDNGLVPIARQKPRETSRSDGWGSPSRRRLARAQKKGASIRV